MEIVNFEKSKVMPLTDEEFGPYERQKYVTFGEKKFKDEDADVKIYRKVRGHCHYTGKYRRAAHVLCSNFLLWMKL